MAIIRVTPGNVRTVPSKDGETSPANSTVRPIGSGIPNNARNRRLPVWISPAAGGSVKPTLTPTPSVRVDKKHRVRS